MPASVWPHGWLEAELGSGTMMLLNIALALALALVFLLQFLIYFY